MLRILQTCTMLQPLHVWHTVGIMAHAWLLRRALLQVPVPRGARAKELLPMLGCWSAGRGPRHHRVPAGALFQIL